MDSERTHRSSTGELFICFTSRFSSSTSNHSSMKISSKSILSPGRTDKFREPQISLSSSLSRRLRSNGSMKGGQASPMFPAAGKKRGGAFENPEPSSPKVTCIGQVRVKTKKGKKMRSRSKRRGEVSFRKIEHTVEGAVVHQGGHGHHLQTQQECLPHRNQRWVHLPLTICEALRAFGADFNCFLPCRSSCTSGEREKEEKGAGESSGGGCAGSSSCGAVFARWLVALQEGEKGREIELVVGEDEKAGEGFHRRHVLDDIEFKLEEDEAKDGIVDGEEARVSICIPPKNALLLMRCRSDPMRMAALTNKFWEPPLPPEEEDDEDENEEDARNEQEQVDMYTDAVEEQEEGEEEEEEEEEGGDTESKDEPETKPELLDEVLEKRVSVDEIEEENSTTVSEQRTTFVTEKEEEEEQDDQGDAPERNPEIIELDREENQEKKEEEVAAEAAQGQEEEAEELLKTGFCLDPLVGSGSVENEEIELTQLLEDQEEQEEEEEEGGPAFPPDRRPSISSPPPPVPVNSEPGREDTPATEALPEDDEEEEIAKVENKESEKSMVSETEEEEETAATNARPDFEQQDQKAREETDKDEGGQKSNQRETQPNPKGGAGVLPDCLLLMMCEPKLSMEVSRETWVCSTDFVRWHPDKPVKPTNGPDQPKTRLSTDSNPSQQQQHHHHHHLQPPRSSCSFPAAASAAGVSMATMIEQKLVNAKAYEPFVLTRCKSEPMRSSAKLAPDPCFWKNSKLEPHRPRVGAAGVGF